MLCCHSSYAYFAINITIVDLMVANIVLLSPFISEYLSLMIMEFSFYCIYWYFSVCSFIVLVYYYGCFLINIDSVVVLTVDAVF